MNVPRLAALDAIMSALLVPDAKAAEGFFGFFTVNIRNQGLGAELANRP